MIVAILAVIAFPAVCSGFSPENTTPVDWPINLTIISPNEGDEVWIDVVPPHVVVIGEADAPSGIENVVVRSEIGGVSCGNGTKFACSVPVSAGENRITIIATDSLRNQVEKSLNVTVHIGIPPPPAITVSGRVTDPEGNPIPNASVRFEMRFALDDEIFSVTNTTGSDGRYLIENAIGYDQTIIVQKEGYQPLRRKIVFGNLTNELDLELEPSGQEVPGFGLQTGIIGVLGALLILRGKKA
ncbi:MAG: carboxypeptidase-like regulatory domain-containing protein [Methanoculleus sp.]|nr:carboxypeptidase-like regulatory domain-containing protein [Methanoculleus sp.]